MSYIGRQNLGGAYRQLDDISSGFDGSDTTHTMQVNSQNVTVGDVNQIILSLGGVIQKPGTDFTVSGSVLTFTTAPAANTSFFAVLLGSDNGGTVTPTDGSVTTAKIVDDAVTAAKVASSGAFAIGAAGTASSLAGIPFYNGDTTSIYTHDVSGTDSTAEGNAAYGLQALDAITTGDYNTAVGYQALTANTTGGSNVALGQAALLANTEGIENVALGKSSLLANTTGDYNIAIGSRTNDLADTENHNLAIGYEAMTGSVAGGEYNVAVGNYTLDALTSGDNNVAVGYAALSAVGSGYDNIAIGQGAALNHTDGQGMTVVGHQAGQTNTTGGSNICIGKATDVSNSNASYQFVIGVNVTGDGNSKTTIGYDTTEISTSHGSASWAAVSDQRYKKDIEDSTAGLSFINDLRPVTFKFKQKNELDTDLYGYDANSTDTDGYTDEVAHGFIAQEIKTVIDNHPEIKAGQEIWNEGPEEKGKRQNVSHTGMIPMMVKAIQELSAKVKALEEA